MPATPNNRKRQLGAELAKLREAAQLRAGQVARHVGVAPSTMTKWEDGTTSPNRGQVETLLDLYNASDTQRELVFTRLADVRQPVARIEHASAVPPGFRSFLRSERDALRERAISQTLMHGLLQTPAYAEATTVTGTDRLGAVPDAARFVASRLARQKRLAGASPLRLHVVMDEAVLHRIVGSRAVLAGQLAHLVTLTEMENVTLQVLPFTAADYIPLPGPVTILDYPNETPTSVYLEQITGGAWVDEPPDVALFEAAFTRAAQAALTPADTVRLLKARKRELA